jgi:hypothetical protein
LTILIPQNDPVDVALDDAGAVGQGEAGGHGLEVLADGVGEDADGIRAAQLGLLDPVPELVSVAVAEHVCELSRAVEGRGDLRAGVPCGFQMRGVGGAEGLLGAHDP